MSRQRTQSITVTDGLIVPLIAPFPCRGIVIHNESDCYALLAVGTTTEPSGPSKAQEVIPPYTYTTIPIGGRGTAQFALKFMYNPSGLPALSSSLGGICGVEYTDQPQPHTRVLLPQPESGAAGGGLTNAELRAAPVEVEVTNQVDIASINNPVALDAATLAALETINAAQSGAWSVDTELTTQNFDTIGTVLAATVGIVVPGAGGPSIVRGDVANGLDVDVTRLPAVALDAASLAALETIELGAGTLAALETINAIGPITNAELKQFASTLVVTATAAAAAAATATLAAAGAGLFHYITSIDVSMTANAAIAAAAGALIITTTNLGGAAWDLQKVQAASGLVRFTLTPSIPIRSAVANTNTTIVSPAVANGIPRVTVTYYTGI
jgi:hypothetical protein